MNDIIEVKSSKVELVASIVALLLAVLLPILVIDSINTLFLTKIPFTLYTWASVVILGWFLKSNTKVTVGVSQ